jgi:hypothetical protein
VLPRALVDAIGAAVTASDSDDRAPLEQLPLDRVERVVGPRGAEVPAEAVLGFDCPLPAELLRPF